VPTTSRLAADPIASAVGHSSGALHGDVVAAAGGSRIRTLGPPISSVVTHGTPARHPRPHFTAGMMMRGTEGSNPPSSTSESLLVVNFAIGDRYWMADGAQNPCTPIHGNANSPGFG
jgi:hypothetical protein